MFKKSNKKFKVEYILILFTVGVIFSFIFTNKILFGEKVQDITLSNSINIYHEKNRIFEDFLDSSRNQLNAINKSKYFKTFLNSKDRKEAKDLFLTLVRASPNIMQLRYIDKDGNEILRVDRDKIGSSEYFVPLKQLQNKKDRYYFSESAKKIGEKVWFSNLDLNIENKKVQIPFIPTIRAILPLRKGVEFNGIIIINYFMEDFLDTLRENTIYNTVLFDKKGNTLTHYENEKSWGFYLEEKYNLKENYEKEINEALIHDEYEDKNIFIKKFNFDISNELYLLIKLKKTYIEELKKEQIREYVVVSFIVFILAIISSFFLSKLFNALTKIISKTDDRLKEASILVKLSYFRYSYSDKSITFDDNFFNLLGYKDIKKRTYNLDELKNFLNQDFLDKLKIKISDAKDEDSFEFENLTKDNKKLNFFTKFRAFHEKNKVIELEGIFQDITKQKMLMKSFEEAKIEAENANQSKSKFLANMSHEIRTPLNGIIGLNELALQSDPNPKIKEFLLKSEISSHALLNVINDILDYSKIEANKLNLEKTNFELDKLLLNVTNLFDYQAYQKEIDLHIDYDNKIPRVLLGDPHRIMQVFNNLVGNAVKFTKSGYIEIKTQLLQNKKNKLLLKCSVKDSGIGMTEEEQGKLFKSFSQVDSSTTRVYGGSGLGLTIAKELVELMGGKIEVSSEKGVGTIFTFTLKLDYENTSLVDSEHFKNKKFLLIDDNEIDIRLISNILNSWGVKTFSCLKAKEALLVLEKDSDFDYILVDWIMPEIDGVDFIKKLKKDNLKNCPKIIMVTAYEEDNLKLKLKEEKVSVNNILRKPFTPSSIYDVLVSFEQSQVNNQIEEIKDKTDYIINAEILVVEDNKINQIICKEMLKRVGAKVTLADDGIEGVKICKENHFDMILMDLHMPNMNGLDATKYIREFNKEIPILALTAAVMSEDKISTKEVGMQGHLSKPIDFDELFLNIQKYIPNLISKKKKEEEKKVIDPTNHIDFDELTKRIGDQNIGNELLIEFSNTYKNYGIDLLKNIETDDFEKDVHKFKGVTGNLSLKVLYNLSIEIEIEKELEKRKELLGELITELNTVINLIKEIK